jgi:hypothetical protein
VQLLDAAALPDRRIAAVLRLDSSLLHDALVVFDPDGKPVWCWPIPTTTPRADPVGLAATADTLLLFWDGRFTAGFSW